MGFTLPYITDGTMVGERQTRGWLWRVKRRLQPQENAVVSGIPASFGQWSAFGWLGTDHDYTDGYTPETFIQTLEAAATAPAFVTRGFHRCPYCPTSPGSFGPTEYQTHDGKYLQLGSACLKVTDQQHRVWLAPNLVLHYISEHGYRPPSEFLNSATA